MIEFQHVAKIYSASGGSVRALDDVSLQVAAGEFVAIRGPSGCGKSTLLSLAGGLDTPTAGRVIVADRDLGQLAPGALARFRAEKLGFVFQMFHLLPYLNVLENVLVAALPGQAAVARPKAEALLDKFGLSARRRHRAAQLSVGERQRVAVARALLNEPRLLLADEPTGNLDPENARATLDLLRDFQRQGGAVLLVTHDDAAAVYADRTIHMRAGRIEQPVAIGGG